MKSLRIAFEMITIPMYFKVRIFFHNSEFYSKLLFKNCITPNRNTKVFPAFG
jgi:hypothetical protein